VESEAEPTREELLLLLSAKGATIAQQSELIEGLVAQVEGLIAQNKGLAGQVEALTLQVSALVRQRDKNSSNSSKPPSSDPPFSKPAPKRSSRTSSGRRRGKQDGAPGGTLKLVADPDERFTCDPQACHGCGGSLAGAPVFDERRHQVFDAPPPPPRPQVTEYRVVSRVCTNCGTTSEGEVPAWARGRVQYGPKLLARAAWLVCAHHLPVRRAASVLATLLGSPVSTGWTAAVRGRAARHLESAFLPRVRELIASAPVAHADETCARADGALRYLHVASTEHLTAMHVGDRTSESIDAGGIWPCFDGVLVRDGYGGYLHLGQALHAWCGAHLLRDLHSVHEGDPAGQLWADAMATTLCEANEAANAARAAGRDALEPHVLAKIRNRYLGALARGHDDTKGKHGPLADAARTLIGRFERHEDMILRFTTDLRVPFTNNLAERDQRPVKVQQRTSGGCWRTLQGLIDFAVVQSYLSTVGKWGLDKLDALEQLFTTGAWLPPALTPNSTAATG
jgi:transposase